MRSSTEVTMKLVLALAAVASVLVLHAEAAADFVTDETITCSAYKSTTAVSLALSRSLADPNGANPFSVCLLCASPVASAAISSGFNSNRFSQVQQTQDVCSNYGDRSRTFAQRYDCGLGEFVRGVRKSVNSLTAVVTCTRVVSGLQPQTNEYEVGFNAAGNPIGSTGNWQSWSFAAMCRESQVMCGLYLTMNNSNVGPNLSPVCCSLHQYSGGDYSISPAYFTSKTIIAWIVCLGLIVLILSVVLILCCINMCCCVIFPESCCKCMNASEFYRRAQSAVDSGRRQSTFTTRPGTAVLATATRNGTADNNNRRGGKRPSTSSVRPADEGAE